MALRSTIYKVELQISNLDRGYYGQHALTLARHPSETEERLMIRLLAFALHAGEDLAFGKGLSTDDEPALLEISPGGELMHWIEVGLPDESRLRKGCQRARRATLLAYGGRAVDPWWAQVGPQLDRYSHLVVWRIADAESAALAALASRAMQVDCTIQEGTLWVGVGNQSVQITPECLKPAGADR